MSIDPAIANVPGPPWAPPAATWEQLIAMMRFWLKPGDEMFTDEQLQLLMLAANSFARAVLAGWHYKFRIYADPNRPISATIGSESFTWEKAADRAKGERELLNRIKRELGLGSGGSRVLAVDEYPQVYGVTPYHTSPPPYLVPSTWPFGSVGFDLSRSGGGTNQFYSHAADAPMPSPSVPESAVPPAPKRTVRPRRTAP